MFNTLYLNYILNFIHLQKFNEGSQIDLLVIASKDTWGREITHTC